MEKYKGRKQDSNNVVIISAILGQQYKEYRHKLFNKTNIKPMMKYREIEIIEDIFNNHKNEILNVDKHIRL